MSKARAQVTRTLRDPARRRPVAAALAAIAAVALITGVILGTGFSGSSRGASRSSAPAGSTTVQRRDLVETDTESGTLGYADSQTVFNRLSGTITALPNIGQVVKAGGTLYDVDGAPVVLMDGSVPAYRTLQAGVSDGLDVQQLKQNLVNLGFDAEHQITINQTFDAATTAAVERWQGSLGETENGVVTLGQVVFLSGDRRITAVDTVLGSTGGSGASSSGASSSSASGGSASSAGGTVANTTSLARTTPAASRPEFVSLTTTDTTTSTTTTTTTSTSTSTTHSHSRRPSGGSGGSQPASTLAALIALLRAETAELQKSRSGSGTTGGSTGSRTASGTSSAGSRAAGRSSSGGSGGSTGARGSTAASSAGGASSGAGGASSSSSAGAGAQAILGTTSTQLVVTVQLDATKQSEAVVGEPVSVELPDGSVADGKIAEVSPVAQTSSSSSSSGSGAGGGSSTPSATIPVTITLTGHNHVSGLDQAAVSVNFQQQKATNVLSVPVSALLATAGGGYAVQEADAPHHLLPVTPGLFAAGYVQVSGDGIYPGLAVTDSQG